MPLLLSLMLFGTEARAAETLLRYDHYADVGDAFFSDLGGLYAGECWATVYEPDEDDYPVKPTELHVLLGGDPDEMRATIHIFNYIGIADAAVMNAGVATEIDREEVLLKDNEVTGTMHEVVLSENGFNLDPIEEGTIVVSVCFVNEQFMPMVGMDTDGYEALADTGAADMASRYMILKGGGGGPWYGLDEWIPEGFLLTDYATGGEFPAGDLVMRLVVDTRVSLGGDGEVTTTDAEIYTITPDSQEAGTSAAVLIHGKGLDAGATARIGTLDLSAVNVTPHAGECVTGACCVADSCYDYTYDECRDAKGASFQLGVSCMSNIVECADDRGEVGDCTDLLNGQTDKALEPGVYDVVITTASGDEVLLPAAYTVAEVKGCGCATSNGSSAAWLLGLFGLMWRRRRS